MKKKWEAHIKFIQELNRLEWLSPLCGPHTCTSTFGRNEGAFGSEEMDSGRVSACVNLGRSPRSQVPSRPLRNGMVTPQPWSKTRIYLKKWMWLQKIDLFSLDNSGSCLLWNFDPSWIGTGFRRFWAMTLLVRVVQRPRRIELTE